MSNKKQKKKTKSEKYGSKPFIERPQRFDAIQFHGPEDFDDAVLSDWLKKYQIHARITSTLNPEDKGLSSDYATYLELTPQRNFVEEPLLVSEGDWIVVKNERTKPAIFSDYGFHQFYMPATDTNS